MPSTYSTDLRIELIANGEQSGTWGTTTNVNLGTLIEDAIAGLASVSVTTANQALTASNGSADQARCAAVSLTTTTLAAFNVYVPPVTKLYVINNASAYPATVFCSTVLGNTTAAGTGVAVPAGKSVLLRSDGTNIVEQLNHVVGAFGVGGALTVTGASTLTGNTAVGGTTTLQNALVLGGAPGTAGQVVVSQGAGNPPAWGNAFVTGMIMMWSGTIATIPSGWVLCNGSSGTPDLRNRFIIGAHSDDAGAAKTTITGSPTQTGGSKDAVLVSHTHTASTSISDPGHRHTVPESTQLLNSGNGFATGVTGTPRTINSSIVTTGISASTSISTEGSSGTNANLVPYFALAYIMKT
jgi:hypothetical protein